MGECRVITDNILIDNKDIMNAQEICNMIDNSELRSRSTANVIGPIIAARILNELPYDIDIESGLHNIVEVLERNDISDIYVNDNYIDVRLYIEGQPLTVPADIVDNIEQSIFMFIKVDTDIQTGSLSGFIPANKIDKENLKDDSYTLLVSDLLPFEDIEPLLKDNDENSVIDDTLIYRYLDNKFENNYDFYSQLIKSKESRIKFINYIKKQDILNYVSSVYYNPKISQDTDVTDGDLNYAEKLDNNISQENIFNDLLDDQPKEEEENIIDTTLSLLEEPETSNNYSENHSSEYTTNTFTNIVTSNPEDEINTPHETQDESIEELFSEERLENESELEQKKGISAFRLILTGIITILVAMVAYLGITKMGNSSSNSNMSEQNNSSREISAGTNKPIDNSSVSGSDAMPLESVESNLSKESKEVGNPVNIPAIEKNLDASVVVSNLKIDWEVPSGYASNASAKRYLIKLGKVIQHNLRAELLLMNKLPITNNVAVEIKFNSVKGQFDVVGITNSSGEENVDKIIMNTVKNALKIKLSSNISTFTKLQGNPILVIHF